MKRIHIIALIAGCMALPIVGADDVSNYAKIGMNVSSVNDYSDYSVFADVFRNGVWIEDWKNRLELPSDLLDDNGKVATKLPANGRTPFAAFAINAKANSVFELQLRGKIRIRISNSESRFYESDNAGLTTLKVRFPKQTAQTVATIVQADKGASAKLFFPGQTGNLFHSEFVEHCKPFDILRNLDWNRTNNSKVVSAADATPYKAVSQGSPRWGCSEVLFLKLCQQANADCYLTIPHLADESYLKQLATWCRQWKKVSDRQIYIEYSNELWNPIFQQSRWCKEQGRKVFPRLPGEKEWRWNMRSGASFAAIQSAKAFKVIDQTFTDYQRVVAWQAAAGEQSSQYVYDAFKKEYGRGPDCWAIAPYVHLHLNEFVKEVQREVSGLTTRQINIKDLTEAQHEQVGKILKKRYPAKKIMELMLTSQNDGLARSIRWMNLHSKFAKERGMRLITYESGQHITPPGHHAVTYPDWPKIMLEVQKLPQMSVVYERYHQAWRDAGGAEHIFFTLFFDPSPKWGRAYGHQDFMGDTDSAKWKALMKIIASEKGKSKRKS